MLALTKLRLELGMSISQLANAADLDYQTVYYQEVDGRYAARPQTAKKIVEVLGVGLWDVYKCDNDRRLVCRGVE